MKAKAVNTRAISNSEMASNQSDSVRKRKSTAIIKLTLWSAMLIFSVSFSMAVGCSSDKPEGESESAAQSSSATQNEIQSASDDSTVDKVALQSADKLLVGEWHGAAWFDEAILVDKLSKLPEADREQALNQAKFFGATIMALVFDNNGKMESVVDVLPEGGSPGPPLIGTGTWEVIREQGESVVVETVEQADDGALTPSQRVYKFYENGNNFAMNVPLTGVLGECNPVIIFERVVFSEDGATENIAEAESDTVGR